jgi:hypothetical protein
MFELVHMVTSMEDFGKEEGQKGGQRWALVSDRDDRGFFTAVFSSTYFRCNSVNQNESATEQLARRCDLFGALILFSYFLLFPLIGTTLDIKRLYSVIITAEYFFRNHPHEQHATTRAGL